VRQTERELSRGEDTYWPGVADLLLAALMIVVLLSFGGLALFALNPGTTDNRLRQLQNQLDTLRIATAKQEKINVQLRAEIERLKLEPPIIELTDAQMVTFGRGQANISSEFSAQLRERVFPQLITIIDKYPSVDTIEIIGHTDDTAIGSPRSNLDAKLAQVFSGDLETSSLQPGSNVDLGLMRAAAVREAWERWLISRSAALPRRIGVRCYSAANAIPPADNPNETADQRARRARRIEIRFTKLKGTNSQS
jgi:outer membrane protein OmpA-like peptidoglycan-associated protein